MMGGDQDASSKGVFGAIKAKDGREFLLIVDPHYYGKSAVLSKLYKDSWIFWKPVEDFSDSSFYNLCLPQSSPPDGAVLGQAKQP